MGTGKEGAKKTSRKRVRNFNMNIAEKIFIQALRKMI